jgi:hypothetical protein
MGRKMMRKKHQANQLFQQMEYMERISWQKKLWNRDELCGVSISILNESY